MAQLDIPVTKANLSEADVSILNKRMKKYKTFSIDKEVLLDRLHHNGRCEFRLNIDSENDWMVVINLKNNAQNHTNYQPMKRMNNCFDVIYIINNAKLTLDSSGETVINGPFEVVLGSQLEVK
ncbi:hypothetical protein FACS1894123_12280 [Bacteroidia bacterium]|nr:hypothetical protein FACS1894123_12280 [Bacteroidia bacterium]